MAMRKGKKQQKKLQSRLEDWSRMTAGRPPGKASSWSGYHRPGSNKK